MRFPFFDYDTNRTTPALVDRYAMYGTDRQRTGRKRFHAAKRER